MKRGFFDYSGSFYHYTGKACDIMILSLLWLLGSLPVITIGASFSALYAASSRSIRQNIGTVFSEYWKSYRREMKSSIPLWLIFAGAILMLLMFLPDLFAPEEPAADKPRKEKKQPKRGKYLR